MHSASVQPTPPVPSTLDRRLPEPLYAQLRDALVRRLSRGDFVAGGPFPTQRELVECYGVSSITARRVLDDLTREGMIERRNGVGTFVRAAPRPKRLALLILAYQEPARRQIASAFGELVGGVAEVVWENGAAMSLAYVRRPDELLRWLDEARETRSADGVLVRAAADVTSAELDILDQARLPFVLVRRRAHGRPASCAVVDDRGAVRLTTTHLIDLGHRRIGFAASTQSSVQFEERLAGYRESLMAAGLALAPGLIARAPDFSADSGEAAALSLLGPGGSAPTALVMGSDSMAIGAYRAAATCGLVIPGDVSITGVADIPEAQVLKPALTTARTSYVELGARAARLLIRAIDAEWRGEQAAPEVDVLEATLVIRESTDRPGYLTAQRSGSVSRRKEEDKP